MIFQDMYVALKAVISELYVRGFVKNKKAGKLAKDALMMAVLLGVAVGGFYLYKYYIYNKQATAQKVLSECLIEYERAAGGMGSWYDVEVALEMGYEQNTGSKLAPYFLAYKADAMLEQGKKQEALAVLQEALEKISPKDDLYGLYAVKLALMKLDNPDSKKEGLQSLEDIAEKDGSGKTGALYNLGLYYWQNNIEKAKGYFEQLVALEVKQDGEIPATKSQFIEIAKEKLEQLS